jgi:hypothetical protein
MWQGFMETLRQQCHNRARLRRTGLLSGRIGKDARKTGAPRNSDASDERQLPDGNGLALDDRRAASLHHNPRFVGRQHACHTFSRTEIDDLNVEGMTGIGQFCVVGKFVAQHFGDHIVAQAFRPRAID